MSKRKLDLTVPGANRKAFAERLIAAIADSDLRSGNALAVAIGCSQQSVHNWLKGNADPSRERLIAVSQSLNVSLEWLATGEGPMERDAESMAEPAAIDQDLLQMIIEEIELFVAERNLDWTAEKKSRVILTGYAMMAKEREPGDSTTNAATLVQLLKAAV